MFDWSAAAYEDTSVDANETKYARGMAKHRFMSDRVLGVLHINPAGYKYRAIGVVYLTLIHKIRPQLQPVKKRERKRWTVA